MVTVPSTAVTATASSTPCICAQALSAVTAAIDSSDEQYEAQKVLVGGGALAVLAELLSDESAAVSVAAADALLHLTQHSPAAIDRCAGPAAGLPEPVVQLSIDAAQGMCMHARLMYIYPGVYMQTDRGQKLTALDNSPASISLTGVQHSAPCLPGNFGAALIDRHPKSCPEEPSVHVPVDAIPVV